MRHAVDGAAPDPMRLLFLLAAVLLAPAAAHAQWSSDPCFDMDSTAWNPGPGWETVGDCAIREVDNIAFDAAGTLYGVGSFISALDATAGLPGVWRRVNSPEPNVTVTNLLPLSTPDSALTGAAVHRTTDGAVTWTLTGPGVGTAELSEAPVGAFRAWRLFASEIALPLQLSDDRGGSWRPVAQHPEGYDLQTTNLAFFPAEPGPWGDGYGGRTIAAGIDYAVALSDDGGDTWRRSSLWTIGRYFEATVLARPAAEGGGLRAVVIGNGPSAPNGCSAVWTSDDGATRGRRARRSASRARSGPAAPARVPCSRSPGV